MLESFLLSVHLPVFLANIGQKQFNPARDVHNNPARVSNIETIVAEDYLSASKHHTPYPLLFFTFNLSGRYEKKVKQI